MLPKGEFSYSIDNDNLTMKGYSYSGRRHAFSAFFLNKKDGKIYYADLAGANSATGLEETEIMIFDTTGEGEELDMVASSDVYCAYPEKLDVYTLVEHIYKFVKQGRQPLSREEWERKLKTEGYLPDNNSDKPISNFAKTTMIMLQKISSGDIPLTKKID